MKKFKSLMRNLQEAGAQSFGGSVFNGFSDPEPRSALSDQGLHYAFNNPEQLARLNAFVNSFLSGTYMDPKEALKELSGRIGQLGLSIRIDNTVKLIAGENSIPVKVFGDKFGTTLSTDLSKGFDTGGDYPDMVLSFNLLQTKQGYVYTDAMIHSARGDVVHEVGAEIDNTHAPDQQNEEYETLEEKKDIKDPARVVELFLSSDKDGSKRILGPIYNNLKGLKAKGKYSSENAMKRFRYAVGSGLRTLADEGKTITLSDDEKTRVANRLLINFEKHIRTIQD